MEYKHLIKKCVLYVQNAAKEFVISFLLLLFVQTLVRAPFGIILDTISHVVAYPGTVTVRRHGTFIIGH
jgi:hypothetical protein